MKMILLKMIKLINNNIKRNYKLLLVKMNDD